MVWRTKQQELDIFDVVYESCTYFKWTVLMKAIFFTVNLREIDM